MTIDIKNLRKLLAEENTLYAKYCESPEQPGRWLQARRKRELETEIALPEVLDELEAARAALKQVRDVGHNDDCLFCGLKDRLVVLLTGETE